MTGKTTKRAKTKAKRKPSTPRFTATVDIGAAAIPAEWTEALRLCASALDTGNYADLCRACIKANRLTDSAYQRVALAVIEATLPEIDKRENVGFLDGEEFRW